MTSRRNREFARTRALQDAFMTNGVNARPRQWENAGFYSFLQPPCPAIIVYLVVEKKREL
jgi:hypothetical protein